MRARNIKPGFFTNEDLAELEPMGRLLFIGLWTLADREGRLEDRPKRIKGALFPYDNCDVDPLLDELQKWGFIKRYQSQGVKCIQIINFSKHQNPHPREAKSVLPEPPAAEEYVEEYTIDMPSHEKALPSNEKVIPSHEKALSSRADSLNPLSLNPDSLIPDTLIPEKETTTTGNRARARFIEESCVDSEWQEVTEAYSNNVRPITGDIELGKLEALFARYGKLWITAAITEAVESSRGSPSLKYIEAILSRWEREGFKSDNRSRKRSRSPDNTLDNPQLRIAAGAMALLEKVEV